MKIALVSSTYLPTRNGITIHLSSLKRQLQSMGHEVYLLAPKNKETYKERGVFRIKSTHNPLAKNYPLPLFTQIPKEIRGVKFDVVHLHHPFGVSGLAKKIARQSNCPIVFTNHTQYLSYAGYYLPLLALPAKIIIKRYLKNFYSSMDAVIGSTSDIGSEIKKIYKKTRFYEIPVGFDSSRFNNTNTKNVKKIIGIKDSDSYILYVGRIASEKNIEGLISAFIKIKDEYPKLNLVLVGEGELLSKLKEKFKDEKKIILLGQPRDDLLVDLYAGSLFFASMSTSEVLPLTFSEAAYCGAPLLGIDSLGVRDIIISGSNGLLATDSKDFEEKIKLMVTDEELLKTFSKNGPDSVNKYSDVHNIKKIETLYKDLIKG